MKKIILTTPILIALLFTVTNILSAQTGVTGNTATVDATATVEAAITLVAESTPNNVVAFGTVANGSSPSLNAETANSDVGPSASMAEYGVNAAAATNIYIVLSSSSVSLTDDDGVELDDIVYTPVLYASNSTSAEGSQTEIISGGNTDSGSQLTGTTATIIDGTYSYYLFLGGTLDLADAVDGVTYSAPTLFTIEVNYF